MASLLVLSVLATAVSAQDADIPFTHVVIDGKPPARPYYKMLGDIDGDGLLDIIVGGAKGPLVWYKYPDWEKREIAPSGWRGVNGEVGDVDGDGDADIVMGGIVWFGNPRLGGGGWIKRGRGHVHDRFTPLAPHQRQRHHRHPPQHPHHIPTSLTPDPGSGSFFHNAAV